MKAMEAFGLAKLREQHGILLDAIEKAAKQGLFKIDVTDIDIGESTYFLDKDKMDFLINLGYKVYIVESNDYLCPDKHMVSWELDE